MLVEITVDQALEIVLGAVNRLDGWVRPILDCLGAVLDEDVAADMDIPPFHNSAMDGYALLAEDTAQASPATPLLLRVVADLPAGYPPTEKVNPGEAVRIMTGAPMPPGADSVIRSEDVERIDPSIRIRRAVEHGEDVRRAGEDVKKGAVVLKRGTLIRPAEVGMLATLGRKQARVVRTPRVAVLATGDELVDPEEPVALGKIRNSNLFTLCAQVKASGGDPVPLGIARDTAEEVQSKIAGALDVDVLITSGGVSVGDFDLVKTVLARMGEILFWKVKMRPGSPVTFGILEGKPMFGLPGNPSASVVAFEQFTRPAIIKMSGRSRLRRREVEATLEQAVNNRRGVRNFIRVVAREEQGRWYARPTGAQGSGILSTMVEANALLVVPETASRLEAGQQGRVQLLDLPEVD